MTNPFGGSGSFNFRRGAQGDTHVRHGVVQTAERRDSVLDSPP